MKLILWGAVALIALLWTGAVAVCVEVLQWSAAALASGEAKALADTAAQLPIPAWLAPFVDLAGWRETVTVLAGWLQSVSAALPPLGDSLGWLVPLAWAVWGVGLIALLVLAALASRFVRI